MSFGHGLGLAHAPRGQASIMQPYVNQWYTPQPYDSNDINNLYW